METYKDMAERHQQLLQPFNIHYIFSKEEYNQLLEECNINQGTAGNGAVVKLAEHKYIKASELDKYNDTMKQIRKERNKAIKADKTGIGFIYQMFLTELANRGYGYTKDEAETLSDLSITESDLESNKALANGLKIAKATILADL